MSMPIKQFRIVGKKGKIVKSAAQAKPARKTKKATKTPKVKLGPKLQREVTRAKRALSRIRSARAQLSQGDTVTNPRPLGSTDIRFSNDIILLRDELNDLIVVLNEERPNNQKLTLSSVLARYGVSPVRPTFAELQSVFNALIEQRDAQQSLEATKELVQLKKDRLAKGKNPALVPKIASSKKVSAVDILPPPEVFRDLTFIDPEEQQKGTPKRRVTVTKKKQELVLPPEEFNAKKQKQVKPKPPETPKPSKPTSREKIKQRTIDAAWQKYESSPRASPERKKAFQEYKKLVLNEITVTPKAKIAQPIFSSIQTSIPGDDSGIERSPTIFSSTPTSIPGDDSGIERSPIPPAFSYEELAADDSGLPFSPAFMPKTTRSREPSKLGQFVETAQTGQGFIVPYSTKRVKNLRSAMGHAERGHFAKALRLIHTQRKMVRDPTHQAEMYVHSLMEE